MFELKGRYGAAKVFADTADQSAISQIVSLLNTPCAKDANIRVMPDVHAGAGCVIGLTMKITDKVCPNFVGVDIGCGMETVALRERTVDRAVLDDVIHRCIPAGRGESHIEPHIFNSLIDLDELVCAKHVNLAAARASMGSLGGGNHFIELARNDAGRFYLIVHTGSRILGAQVAAYYQRAGWKELTNWTKTEIKAVIQPLIDNSGQMTGIPAALKAMGAKPAPVPESMAYVTGSLMADYLHDMAIVQQFANLNRKAITDDIMGAMGMHEKNRFTTVHNYIDLDGMILRKGAVSAKQGEKLLIPLNMRDGSLICTGKGNPDWNCSAPHGAGRLMSRSEAKQRLTVGEFNRQMNAAGVFTTCVCESTLDESPMAYKDPQDIIQAIEPTCHITERLTPVYNFKAC